MDEQQRKAIVGVHESGINPPQKIRFEQAKNLFRKTYREAAGGHVPETRAAAGFKGKTPQRDSS